MDERLTDAGRRALEGLRAGRHDQFLAADPWTRGGLVRRGLVLRVFSPAGERYGLTDRGYAALATARRPEGTASGG